MTNEEIIKALKTYANQFNAAWDASIACKDLYKACDHEDRAMDAVLEIINLIEELNVKSDHDKHTDDSENAPYAESSSVHFGYDDSRAST